MQTRVSIGDGQLNVLDQGRGQPLLLVHGFPVDHTMWQGQIDGLSDVCRVLAPDLRGFGKSDVTRGTVSMERFADDLADLLDALNVTTPVTLCGLSMGGYIAWQFWRRHAGRLAGLILCDTRAAADTDIVARGRIETAERVLEGDLESLANSMRDRLFAKQTPTQRPELVEDTLQIMRRTDPHGVAAALRGMAARSSFNDLLSEIRLPTLVVCGEEDVISSASEMQQIAGAIPGAQFRAIPAAGHMAPLEQPETVNRAIREFLSA